MDFLSEREKRYKPWKAPKMRKRVKTSKLSRIPNNIFETCKRLFSGLFRPASSYTPPMSAVPLEHQLPPLRHHQDPNAFMACVLKTDPSKRGWLNTAYKVASKCEDRRVIVDKETGAVEVAGICDFKHAMKRLGKSTKVRKFQLGNCSKYLFIPEAKTKSSSHPQPNYYHDPTNGAYNIPYLPNHGYGYYQQQPNYGYGYYQQPEAYMEHSYLSNQGYGYHDYQPRPEYFLPYYRY